MSLKTQRWALAGILALYLVLGAAYSIVNPILESPDEALYYENIRFFAEQRRLPVLREGELTKGHHPPLYYALGALAVGWMPGQPLDTFIENNNPFWGYRLGQQGSDNKSLYVHEPSLERWPYYGVSLGVHIMRWLSLLMGAGIIIVVYLIAMELFFQERWLALGAAALVAFNPMFLYIQSSVHSDALTNFLAALALWGIVRYWLHGPSPQRALFVGLVCGLGMMTKITFLSLVAAVLLAMAWRHWLERRANQRWWQDLLRQAFIAIGVMVLIAGWWFVRNQLIYGEPTSMVQQSQVWGIRENAPDVRAAWRELGFLYASFWGVFGYGQIPMPSWLYTLLGALAWVAAGGLVAWLLRSWQRGWHYRVPAALLGALLIAPLAVFATVFARMTVSPTADFGRYLFTAYGVIAPAVVLGVTEWLPSRWRQTAIGMLSIALLVLSILALTSVVAPAYRGAPRLPADQADRNIQHRLDWQFGEVTKLLGYDIEPSVVNAGQDVTVTFYWQPSSTPDRNYTVFVHLLGEGNELVGARDTYPGLGNDPTTLWKPGEIIVDAIPIPVAADAAGPILLDIEAGLYDLTTGDRLAIRDAAGNAVGYPVIGTVKLSANQETSAAPSHTLNLAFEGGLVLEGYDLSVRTLSPGSALTLTIYWSPAGPLSTDYTTFVHLVDKNGQILAQGDGPPRHGRYPTTAWAEGEHFEDAYTFSVPGDALADHYYLLVGLYDFETGQRLSLTSGGDHIRLDSVIEIEHQNSKSPYQRHDPRSSRLPGNPRDGHLEVGSQSNGRGPAGKLLGKPRTGCESWRTRTC